MTEYDQVLAFVLNRDQQLPLKMTAFSTKNHFQTECRLKKKMLCDATQPQPIKTYLMFNTQKDVGPMRFDCEWSYTVHHHNKLSDRQNVKKSKNK